MCECHQSTKQCQPIDEKILKKDNYKIWNLASFAMDTQQSFPHNGHNEGNGWIPMGSNDWPQMQCIKLRTKGWGKPNIVCNTSEKTSKDKWKHGMIGQVDNQALVLGLA